MKKVYFVGKAIPEKGIEDFAFLARNTLDASFYWFCFGTSKELQEKYPEIHFITGLTGNSLSKKTKTMDIFISCSYFEGFCMPIAEALLQEKPALVYELPELRSVYKDHVTYITKGEKEEFLVRLQEAIQAKSYSQVKTAREYIEENFSPKIVSGKLLSFLLE